jgi:hypothetical protein
MRYIGRDLAIKTFDVRHAMGTPEASGALVHVAKTIVAAEEQD